MAFSESNTSSPLIAIPRVISSAPSLIRSIVSNSIQTPWEYFTVKYFNNLSILVKGLPLSLRQNWEKFYTLPLALAQILSSNKISFTPKFFNHIRSDLIRSSNSVSTLGSKSTHQDEYYSTLVTSQTSPKLPIKTVWSRLFTYSIFLSNLRRNPIRRPLYSTFLNSSKILRTHTFRLTSIKGMSSLQKFPTRSFQNTQPLKFTGLTSSFFMSQGDSFIELNINCILTRQVRPNYQYRLNWNLKRLKSRLSSANSFFAENLSNQSLSRDLKKNILSKISISDQLLQNSSFSPLPFNDVRVLLNSPLTYKFFFWNFKNNYSINDKVTDLNWSHELLKSYSKTLLRKSTTFNSTNLVPLIFFKSSLKKKVIKTLSNDIYLPRSTIFFYKTIIRFIEHHTGKKVFLKLNPFLEGSLSFSDTCRCSLWYNKINTFQKILGHRIFVHESLRIFMAAIRFRDPTFLSNWIRAMLYRMSFWKYRVLFRYIKYALRSLFGPCFRELNFKGIKLTLRGKISVAGNARARTLAFSVGNTSHSEMNNRVLSSFTTIDSFTGVMGFRLSFYF
jgi:hypothetical protein